jgi:dipeptidyl aminopeptidase/acylaminoacyl peptidase
MADLQEYLDEGREHVAAMDPPTDLWARALARSNGADADLLDLTGSAQRRRPTFWLAVAAVAAVFVVVTAVVATDRDEDVDTAPVAEDPSVTDPPQGTTTGPRNNGRVAFYDNRFGSWDVFLVESGVGARPLEGAASSDDEVCPTWSPDGMRLAFGRQTTSPDTADMDVSLVILRVERDGSTGVPQSIALDGFRPLPGFDPHPCAVWSSDGRWIALAGGGEVWVIETQTGAIQRIPDLRPSDLEWRPGTDELAIAGDMGSDRGDPTASAPVVMYSASAGDLRQLGSIEAAHITWAPDGSVLAHQAGEGGPSSIGLVDADGTGERLLVADAGEANHGIGPVWSPTGDRIAFQRLIGDSAEGHEVVLVTVADGSQTVIAPPESNEAGGVRQWFPYYVTWAPDGRTLLYSAWHRGGSPGASTPSGLLAVSADAPDEFQVLTDSAPATGDYSHRWAATQMWGRQEG